MIRGLVRDERGFSLVEVLVVLVIIAILVTIVVASYGYSLAKTEEMAIADALTIALELETNMIERNYFKLFHGDSDELKTIFQNLESDTQQHTNRVRNTLVSLKKHGLSRG